LSRKPKKIHLSQKAREGINQLKIPTIVVGDLNIPIESNIYRNHWKDLLNAFSEKDKVYEWSTENSIKSIYIKPVLIMSYLHMKQYP